MLQIPLIHSLDKQAKTDADRRLKFHSHLSLCLCHPGLVMKEKNQKKFCRKRSFIFFLRETPLTSQTRKLDGNLLIVLKVPCCTQVFPPVRPESRSNNVDARNTSERNSCQPSSISFIELRSSFKGVIPTLTTMTGNLETGRRCFTTLKIWVNEWKMINRPPPPLLFFLIRTKG